MRDVFTQYGEFLEERRGKVREAYPDYEPDMRTGWLLWQRSLREFLYFEEETLAPDPEDYTAKWQESGGGGGRKKSKNLWVYEKETGEKRYSVTTVAGAKIQPYFDVPPPGDPNVYIFRVQGEATEAGLVRLWITAGTERELRRLVGDLGVDNMSLVIASVANDPSEAGDAQRQQREEAKPLLLTSEAYDLLNAAFPGISDEHAVQLLGIPGK